MQYILSESKGHIDGGESRQHPEIEELGYPSLEKSSMFDCRKIDVTSTEQFMGYLKHISTWQTMHSWRILFLWFL